MKTLNSLFSIAIFSISLIQAQQPATTAQQVENALKQKMEMAENSIVKNVLFQNIGPTVIPITIMLNTIRPTTAPLCLKN